MARTSGTFGTVEQLAGGHYRARYTGPDGRRYKAPTTFLSKMDARGWLAIQQADIIRKAWVPPEATPKTDRKLPFRNYAKQWLLDRHVKGEPLKVRTVSTINGYLTSTCIRYSGLCRLERSLPTTCAPGTPRWARAPRRRAHMLTGC